MLGRPRVYALSTSLFARVHVLPTIDPRYLCSHYAHQLLHSSLTLCSHLWSTLFTFVHIFTHCSPFSSLCAPLHPATCVQFLQFIYPLFTPLVTFSYFPFGFGLLWSIMYTSTVCSPLCLLCASLNKHTHFHLCFTFVHFLHFVHHCIIRLTLHSQKYDDESMTILCIMQFGMRIVNIHS